ncbi:Membrane-bound lytic murein transglycosylase D [termite gut metagenome]|uniref:Membrane-bound lytic murein transglycosylase D n=1 Tax=termite gut metagenome TaxID=433724 RepID=A0A5J4R4K6_9ZZZZ
MNFKKKKSNCLPNLYWIVFLFLWIVSTPINAQDATIADTVYSIDSLLSDWDVKAYTTFRSNCDNVPNENPVYSDSMYINRMSLMPTIMEMPYNEIVRRYIDVYTGRMRNQISFMLGISNFYVPIFEDALDACNLPIELKYLPVIESALNPSAVSRRGASGLWQFMIKTGKRYGLESNSLVDERRDPIKSTWAAVRYLKDLYNIYHDWNLVIAAYNCGPGNVNKAIRRSGGQTDYWSIYPYLPRETRGYVPAFIAVNYVMHYYNDHNICPVEVTIPTDNDTLHINQQLHFEQIMDICDISLEQIRILNPQYKKDIIPGGKTYTLRLPYEKVSVFIDKQDSIYTHRVNELFSNRAVVIASTTRATKGGNSANSVNGVIYHKIKTGESLSVIARKYQVSVSDLKKWNNLSSSNINAGKQLKILN